MSDQGNAPLTLYWGLGYDSSITQSAARDDHCHAFRVRQCWDLFVRLLAAQERRRIDRDAPEGG